MTSAGIAPQSARSVARPGTRPGLRSGVVARIVGLVTVTAFAIAIVATLALVAFFATMRGLR